MKLIKLVLGLFLGCNLSDFITTKIGLSFSNIYETNKFCVSLGMNSLWYILFKLFGISGVGLLAYWLCGKTNRQIDKLIISLSLFSMGIVFAYATINNINVILHCI